jgi:hypothetical protein
MPKVPPPLSQGRLNLSRNNPGIEVASKIKQSHKKRAKAEGNYREIPQTSKNKSDSENRYQNESSPMVIAEFIEALISSNFEHRNPKIDLTKEPAAGIDTEFKAGSSAI